MSWRIGFKRNENGALATTGWRGVMVKGSLVYVRAPTKTEQNPELRHWADEIKEKALIRYLQTGEVHKTGKLLGIPPSTMTLWSHSNWWKEGVRLHKEEEVRFTDIKLSKIIDGTLKEIQNRVDNGDYYVNKQGELKTKPLAMRDLNNTFQIAMDKRQVLRNLPTKIIEQTSTAKQLEILAERFKEFVNGKSKETMKEVLGESLDSEAVHQLDDGTYQYKGGEDNAIPNL